MFADKRHLLSGITRRAAESDPHGEELEILTQEDAEKLLASPDVPQDETSRAMLLLGHFSRFAGGRLGGRVLEYSAADDYPLCFARDADEFKEYVRHLATEGYIERSSYLGNIGVKLTFSGSRALTEYGKKSVLSTRAFVAMWADETMELVYRNAMVPALAATGWTDDCVNWRKRTENLDEAILEGIKKCGLIVADVTGNRPCVYYEAGYAHALGKPVILTVRKDFWDVRENRQFDTGKWRHVIWTDIAHLRAELVQCITDSGLVRRPTEPPRADAGSSANAQLSP